MSANRKLLVAALAGAGTIFIWGGLSHMVLLKGVGFSRLPDEDRVISQVRRSIPDEGLYFIPALDLRKTATPEEQATWEAKFRAGPRGMIVVQPSGDTPVSSRKLLVQMLRALFASLIATWVVAQQAGASFRRRLLVTGSLGAFSWLTRSTIYWNWYGFPNAFAIAQCVDMVVGWCLAGAVVAGILGREHARPRAS